MLVYRQWTCTGRRWPAERSALSQLPRGFHAVIRLSLQLKIKKPRSSTPAHPSLSLAWTQSAMAWRWAHISFHEVGTEHSLPFKLCCQRYALGCQNATQSYLSSVLPPLNIYMMFSLDLVSEGEKHSNAMANALHGMKKRQCFCISQTFSTNISDLFAIVSTEIACLLLYGF